MSDKRPVWYADWKTLYRRESMALGNDVLYQFNGRHVVIDRHIWKRICRLRRLKKRLHLEWEVMDKTLVRDIVKTVVGD